MRHAFLKQFGFRFLIGNGIFTLSPGDNFPPNFKVDLTQMNSKGQMERKCSGYSSILAKRTA